MFFLPLFDDNKSNAFPIITIALIATCALVFFIQISGTNTEERIFILTYGAIPSVVIGYDSLPPQMNVIHPWLSLITSTFLHGGWLHILGNMLFLWIYGDNVEDKMGRLKFLAFYIICGTAASLTHVAIDTHSNIPLIGASGAIAGVMASYLILFPKARIRVLLIILIFIRFTYFPAYLVIGVWALFQIIAVPATLASEGGGTAYFAHIGGFIAGIILTPIFKKRGVKLLSQPKTKTQAKTTKIPARQIKNEFIQRYKQKPRKTSIPSVKKTNNKTKTPWG